MLIQLDLMDDLANRGNGVMMISPEQTVSNRLDAMTGAEQENQRLQTLKQLGLLELESIPVFEEATQTAAHFLEAAICVLGLLDQDRQYFKSAVGLSRLGLMNSLAASRQLSRTESLGTQVVDRQQVQVIADTTAKPEFAKHLLVERYGIRAYLGVPLMTSSGDCVGTLEVMELSPRSFTAKEIDFLQLMARWAMSEFERDRLLKQSNSPSVSQTAVQTATQTAALGTLSPAAGMTIGDYARFPQPTANAGNNSGITTIKANLIAQMTQDLSTPLTSILGMGSVLSQGIYGSLTDKQKEYIAIIHNSGQYLMSLVNEIVELGGLDDSNPYLNLAPVDVEMLCQQAIATLNQAAERREQQIQLTVEPGPRVWLLDKDKVRQMMYHLVFSVIQFSTAGGTIRIHVSRRQSDLNIMVWTSHPWLDDGLPQDFPAVTYSDYDAAELSFDDFPRDSFQPQSAWEDEELGDDYSSYSTKSAPEPIDPNKLDGSRPSLGLELSRHLAEMHGGSVTIRGSIEEGYRYVIRLPQMRGDRRNG